MKCPYCPKEWPDNEPHETVERRVTMHVLKIHRGKCHDLFDGLHVHGLTEKAQEVQIAEAVKEIDKTKDERGTVLDDII